MHKDTALWHVLTQLVACAEAAMKDTLTKPFSTVSVLTFG